MSAPQGQYVCGRCFSEADHQYFLGQTTIYGVCVRCGGQACFMVDTRVREPHPDSRDAVLEFSTAQCLEVHPSVTWDVNHYYHELGVRHDATRLEIKQAYQRANGHESERLTYIVKQLLDPEMRRKYDSCQLGEVFFDEYYRREVERAMVEDAAAAFESGDIEDGEELVRIDERDRLGTSIDLSNNKRARRSTPWGHFLWASTCSDTERMAEWRSSLAGAFTNRGEIRRLSVGYHADQDRPWVVHPVGEELVVFLHEDENPTTAMAAEAAAYIGSM